MVITSSIGANATSAWGNLSTYLEGRSASSPAAVSYMDGKGGLIKAGSKVVYERLHPETVNGANQHTRVRNNCEGSDTPDRFTLATAKATGRSAFENEAGRLTTYQHFPLN